MKLFYSIPNFLEVKQKSVATCPNLDKITTPQY